MIPRSGVDGATILLLVFVGCPLLLLLFVAAVVVVVVWMLFK